MPYHPQNAPPLSLSEIDTQLYAVAGDVERLGLWLKAQAEDQPEDGEDNGAKLAVAHAGLSEGAEYLCGKVDKLRTYARYICFPDD